MRERGEREEAMEKRIKFQIRAAVCFFRIGHDP